MSFSRLTLGAMLVGATMFGVTALAQTNTDQSAATTQATTTTTTTSAAKPVHHSKAMHHKDKAAMVVMVDINSADAATLAKVKGLTAKRAQAIVAYRTKNGNFKSLQDLKNVTNAKGKSMFSDRSIKMLAHRLTVGDASAPATSQTNQ